MAHRVTNRARRGSAGVSVLEMTIVVAIGTVVAAMALPNLLASRRAIRSNAMTREIVSAMRLARQEAMSQKQVFTCRYDDQTKEITVINHKESGITYDPVSDTMVQLPGNTAASADVNPDVIAAKSFLVSTGVAASDIVLGVPASGPTTALDDGISAPALPASKQINITFQPDGSVVDKNGNPINRSLFLYNAQLPQQSAFAITVLGTTGRIKLWRLNGSGNAYAE